MQKNGINYILIACVLLQPAWYCIISPLLPWISLEWCPSYGCRRCQCSYVLTDIYPLREQQVASSAAAPLCCIHSHPQPRCRPHSVWSAGRAPSSSPAQMWSTREPRSRLGYDSSSLPSPWMRRELLINQVLDQFNSVLISQTQQVRPPVCPHASSTPTTSVSMTVKRQLDGEESQGGA